jgi:hypothetical protein
MNDQTDATALLREIRDNQRLQLERQAEALELQRRQFELLRPQMERAEALQSRAEALQGRAHKAIRFVLWIAIPLLVLVMLLMAWPWLLRVF